MEYAGYEVESSTQQLAKSGEWTLRVSITKHRDSQGVTNQRFYSAANTFLSREEADIESIEFGKKIIDGEVSDCDINGL